jgi:hypothetical protein
MTLDAIGSLCRNPCVPEIRRIRKSEGIVEESREVGRWLPVRMRWPQRSGLQMRLLDALVEQRIAAAAARGEFDDLPGAGVPLALDDDALVPEEVRVANRILKNAGFVPPAVEQLRALRDLQAELNAVSDPSARCRLQARMLALDMALESLRGGPMVVPREYCRRIAERLSGRAAADSEASVATEDAAMGSTADSSEKPGPR